MSAGLPGEIVKNLEDDKAKKDEEYSRVENQLEKDASVIEKIIHNNANPNPVVVALVILLIIVVVWWLYVFLLKPNMSGTWIINDKVMIHIDHCMWSNNIYIRDHKGVQIDKGKLVGNILRLPKLIGLWDGDDLVMFPDYGAMKRIRV
jgi:hypothetical protein